jgi:hypothetical protein
VRDGQPRLRQIRLGEVVGDRMVEVLAGLREGERVALDPVRAGSAAPSASLPAPLVDAGGKPARVAGGD